jgi:hypothetical protein
MTRWPRSSGGSPPSGCRSSCPSAAAAPPRAALELFVDAGLADVVLPELPALRMEIDEHHQHKDVYSHSLTVLDQAIALEAPGGEDGRVAGPGAAAGRAAARHRQAGHPAARAARRGSPSTTTRWSGAKLVRKRLQALRYPKEVIEAVARLTFLHLRFHGYGRGEWTDSAVRRYVTDAGDLLPRLHKLVRSDCTTRNQRAGRRAVGDLRLAGGADRRALGRRGPRAGAPRPRRHAIMAILGLPPGREVGQAWAHLKELGWSAARWPGGGRGRAARLVGPAERHLTGLQSDRRCRSERRARTGTRRPDPRLPASPSGRTPPVGAGRGAGPPAGGRPVACRRPAARRRRGRGPRGVLAGLLVVGGSLGAASLAGAVPWPWDPPAAAGAPAALGPDRSVAVPAPAPTDRPTPGTGASRSPRGYPPPSP